MVQYMVNHAGVNDVHAELGRRTQQITLVLQQLEGTARRTLAAWEGQAQTAFHVAQAEWNSAANSMLTLLNSRSATLNQINHDYQQSDQQASRMLR